ncbi:MAG: serine/threonine protein kinase [Myxococcales bacterium]|nr:serine/threonine protein kinase [Myxococcales bacterium]
MRRAQQLGRYHLLDRIAFGGMAEIYRAKTFDASGHAHIVAVKRVLAHLAEDDDIIQMLVDEAKIAGLLKHPNVARVYEFARAHGEYFIAMEHVDGKDLRAILERCRQDKRPMPPSHAAYVGAEMAAALHAAHSATDKSGESLKIVHRDVSPSNIICAYAGEVKLCDFGIAKATLSRVQTRTGVIKGKVKYMSPEQALGRKLDHRSDIFSLGSVLYEMLTRVPPFTATSEMGLLIKVRDAKYRRISDIVPNVPPEIESITDKCLARSRANRFQSADDVHRALSSFLRGTMPNYSRSHLGRYVRKHFSSEIERELRMLEEYVVSAEPSSDVGENLISNVLGPNAEFSRFSPHADGTQVEDSEAETDVRGKCDQGASTRVDDEDEERTEINASPQQFETNAIEQPGGVRQAGTAILDGAPTRGRIRSMPAEIDEELHNAPTLILDGRRR